MHKVVRQDKFWDIPLTPTSETLAYAFALKYKGRLYYHHPRKKWFWRLGKRWQEDRSVMVFDFARLICREFNCENQPSLEKNYKFVVEVVLKARRLFSEGGYNAGESACSEIAPPTPQELAN